MVATSLRSTPTLPGQPPALIVASSRLPVTVRRTAAGLTSVAGSGGLVAVLEPLLRDGSAHWLGWPGDAPHADGRAWDIWMFDDATLDSRLFDNRLFGDSGLDDAAFDDDKIVKSVNGIRMSQIGHGATTQRPANESVAVRTRSLTPTAFANAGISTPSALDRILGRESSQRIADVRKFFLFHEFGANEPDADAFFPTPCDLAPPPDFAFSRQHKLEAVWHVFH